MMFTYWLFGWLVGFTACQPLLGYFVPKLGFWKQLHGLKQHFSTFLTSLNPWNGWVGFYGITTIVGYLMPNPVYMYISNISDLVCLGFMAYQPL